MAEYSMPAGAISLGYQQLSGLSSAQPLTVPAEARYARISPQTQAVRWRDDGTNPTATVGMPLAVGAELIYSGNLRSLKFFEQAASAVLNIVYYRDP